MTYIDHDIEAELDYTISWAEWLNGESIVTSSWEVPSGLTEYKPATFTSDSATVWIAVATGTVGSAYSVWNTITTPSGRKQRRELQFRISG